MENNNLDYTPKKTPGMAIASMILGIVSLVSCCIVFISLPCAIIGLILGIISLKKEDSGKGMAIAGIVLSSIFLLWGIFIAIAAIFAPQSDFLKFLNNIDIESL